VEGVEIFKLLSIAMAMTGSMEVFSRKATPAA